VPDEVKYRPPRAQRASAHPAYDDHVIRFDTVR
jgi:hypothetical protein